jgi:hypothetical protein
MTRTVIPSRSATVASATPAPTADAAMMLCPHAWPIGADADDEVATAEGRVERRRQVRDPRPHVEPAAFEQFGDLRDAAELLEREFGFAVDRMGQRYQIGLD